MSTITVSRASYEALKRRAAAYDRIVNVARADVFASPPTRDPKIIMHELRATKKYSPAFLKSLAQGLARSPYFGGK